MRALERRLTEFPHDNSTSTRFVSQHRVPSFCGAPFSYSTHSPFAPAFVGDLANCFPPITICPCSRLLQNRNRTRGRKRIGEKTRKPGECSELARKASRNSQGVRSTKPHPRAQAGRCTPPYHTLRCTGPSIACHRPVHPDPKPISSPSLHPALCSFRLPLALASLLVFSAEEDGDLRISVLPPLFPIDSLFVHFRFVAGLIQQPQHGLAGGIIGRSKNNKFAGT